jgi:hypothetical protein
MLDASDAARITDQRLNIYKGFKQKLLGRCDQLIRKKCAVGEKSCLFAIPKAQMGLPLYNPVMFSDFLKHSLEHHNYKVTYYNGDPSVLVIKWG